MRGSIAQLDSLFIALCHNHSSPSQDILYEDDEDEDAREEVDDRYMFDDMTAYYKVGDQVKAFVLGFDTK